MNKKERVLSSEEKSQNGAAVAVLLIIAIVIGSIATIGFVKYCSDLIDKRPSPPQSYVEPVTPNPPSNPPKPAQQPKPPVINPVVPVTPTNPIQDPIIEPTPEEPYVDPEPYTSTPSEPSSSGGFLDTILGFFKGFDLSGIKLPEVDDSIFKDLFNPSSITDIIDTIKDKINPPDNNEHDDGEHDEPIHEDSAQDFKDRLHEHVDGLLIPDWLKEDFHEAIDDTQFTDEETGKLNADFEYYVEKAKKLIQNIIDDIKEQVDGEEPISDTSVLRNKDDAVPYFYNEGISSNIDFAITE